MVNINENHIKVTDTKTKILAVANELFARHGFDGVSIRDIAQEAEVNVASVNYHFKNKLNLLHFIFEYNYRWMEEEVQQLTRREGIDTATLSGEMFELFSHNGTALINGFKMILSDHLCPQEDGLSSEGQGFGPPGGEAILEVITKEVGESVPFEERHWAMRMIFGNIIHFATMINATYIQKKCEKEEWIKPETKKTDIMKMANAIISSLKGH